MKRESPVRFFFKHAGWSYRTGESSLLGRWRCARALADAERWATEQGIRFQWEHDQEADRSGIEHSGPLWWCVAWSAGELVGSLGAVDLGESGAPHDVPYARVVEAEIASEIHPSNLLA